MGQGDGRVVEGQPVPPTSKSWLRHCCVVIDHPVTLTVQSGMDSAGYLCATFIRYKKTQHDFFEKQCNKHLKVSGGV